MIGITISFLIFKSKLWIIESKVRVTDPSMEFSMGTTPYSHSPFATDSMTEGMEQNDTKSSDTSDAASCENVPWGPKNATGLILSPKLKLNN